MSWPLLNPLSKVNVFAADADLAYGIGASLLLITSHCSLIRVKILTPLFSYRRYFIMLKTDKLKNT